MTTSIYPSFQPIIHRYMANEKSTSLKIQIEPWAFDTLQERFPESGEYDYRLIKNNLYDCILKYQRTIADKLHLGTEIMFDFLGYVLIFEVKHYSQNFNQSQIEEIYFLDLSRIERKHNNKSFLNEIEKKQRVLLLAENEDLEIKRGQTIHNLTSFLYVFVRNYPIIKDSLLLIFPAGIPNIILKRRQK